LDFFEKLREEHGINLTEQQKEAVINIYGHTLVLAVPGAGKTQTLLCRTAYMIDQDTTVSNQNKKNVEITKFLKCWQQK
jgi:hypothetical protein